MYIVVNLVLRNPLGRKLINSIVSNTPLIKIWDHVCVIFELLLNAKIDVRGSGKRRSERKRLRWLKTVSSTSQVVDFDGS